MHCSETEYDKYTVYRKEPIEAPTVNSSNEEHFQVENKIQMSTMLQNERNAVELPTTPNSQKGMSLEDMIFYYRQVDAYNIPSAKNENGNISSPNNCSNHLKVTTPSW